MKGYNKFKVGLALQTQAGFETCVVAYSWVHVFGSRDSRPTSSRTAARAFLDCLGVVMGSGREGKFCRRLW